MLKFLVSIFILSNAEILPVEANVTYTPIASVTVSPQPNEIYTPQLSASSIVGASLGGAFVVVIIILIIIRFHIVSAQLNASKVSRLRKKNKITSNRLGEFEIVENPVALHVRRMNSLTSSY